MICSRGKVAGGEAYPGNGRESKRNAPGAILVGKEEERGGKWNARLTDERRRKQTVTAIFFTL